jgi:1,4-alpha-glucan branching enzyme
VNCPGAQKVFLAGDFNGWDPCARRMKRAPRAPDTFVAVLDLDPGCYQYKFVADEQWICGADCPTAMSACGTENNVIEVCETCCDE